MDRTDHDLMGSGYHSDRICPYRWPVLRCAFLARACRSQFLPWNDCVPNTVVLAVRPQPRHRVLVRSQPYRVAGRRSYSWLDAGRPLAVAGGMALALHPGGNSRRCPWARDHLLFDGLALAGALAGRTRTQMAYK